MISVSTLSCPHIDTSDMLKLNTSNTNIGTAVFFSCPTGFELIGEATQLCRDDGKDAFECKLHESGQGSNPDGQVHKPKVLWDIKLLLIIIINISNLVSLKSS